MAAMEIITRTERRRRWSDVEREAILADADRPGTTVKAVARRHGVAESLVYGWRKARRQAEAAAAEPMQFIAYGALDGSPALPPATMMVSPAPAPAPVPAPRPVREPVAPEPRDDDAALDELVRPHPGSRPGSIDIALRTGVRLSVDSYVNERALTRVLRALKAMA